MRILLYLFITIVLSSCAFYSDIEKVEGEWELYENSFIRSRVKLEDSCSIVNFPGDLYESVHGNKVKYGSLRKVLSLKSGESYSLLFNGIYSASRIWIDGRLIKVYGEIGETREDTIPFVTPDIITFTPTDNQVELVIEFSNFHLRENLVFKWIKIGTPSDILNEYMKSQAKDYFSAGTLIIISIFFMLIYVSNIKSRYNLYFSLFTLSYGIRSFFMEKTSIMLFIPNFPWELIYQLTKASELWALVTILLFFSQLYPMELKSKVSRILIVLALLLSLLSFLPVNIFSNMKIMYISHLMVLVTGNYFILRIFKAVRNRRTLATLSLISITFFSLATVNDILANRYVVSWGYYSAQVVILLVITMCILVSKERSITAENVKEQERHNSLLRRTFARFVPVEILEIIGNKSLENRPPGESIVKPQTIAYIDIRDYTKLSLELTPEENFHMINNFFKIVGNYVLKNNGFIESYGGDGVKIIFPDSPQDAINMAMGISDEVHKTSKIKIGISINFGQVVLGTIGSKNRIQATALSSVTRELTAMDHFNSKMGVEILISSNVFELSNLTYSDVMYLGNIKLKDEEVSQCYYQLIPSNFRLDEHFKESFENGVKQIENKNFPKAYGFFSLANRINPSHQLTIYYLKTLDIFFKLKEHSFVLSI